MTIHLSLPRIARSVSCNPARIMLCIAVLGAWAAPVHASIHYVTNTDLRLQDVIDTSGPSDTIVLTSGIYRVAGREYNGSNVFVLDRGITLASMSPLPGEQAVIDGQGLIRCATILNGTVMGVTFVNGSVNGQGGGVWCENAGMLDRCIIRNCYADALAGGAFVKGTLRSCLIVSNTAGSSGGAGIVIPETGLVYNCTIADNSTIGHGGGVVAAGGLIANSIIVSNASSYYPVFSDWFTNDHGGTFSHCCTTPEPPGPGNIVADPLFLTGYLINQSSPCFTQGVVYGWMAGAYDLAGAPRTEGAGPDLGAFEAIPEPALVLPLIAVWWRRDE